MLTQCMALELAEHNIQVNSVTAGGVATELTDPEREASLLSSIPAGRIAQPAEVAKLVSYLVSPAADYVTGSAVRIDGGLLLGFCATRKDL